ncbi:MAG: hypothetical protein Q9169_008441 [Polycauliona sp. 2 TL-2023]
MQPQEDDETISARKKSKDSSAAAPKARMPFDDIINYDAFEEDLNRDVTVGGPLDQPVPSNNDQQELPSPKATVLDSGASKPTVGDPSQLQTATAAPSNDITHWDDSKLETFFGPTDTDDGKDIDYEAFDSMMENIMAAPAEYFAAPPAPPSPLAAPTAAPLAAEFDDMVHPANRARFNDMLDREPVTDDAFEEFFRSIVE